MDILALWLFRSSFLDSLIVESDSSNACGGGPWRFHFLFLEIIALFSQVLIEFKHMGRSDNTTADALAPLIAHTV